MAPRITSSARLSTARISATGRPPSLDSTSSASDASDIPRASASRIASRSERYTLCAHFVEAVRPSHPGEGANIVRGFIVGHLVELDHHERIAAALYSRQLERRDIEAILGEDRGDPRDRATHVLCNQNDRVIRAGHFHGKTVDPGHEDPAGAKGRAQHHRVAIAALQRDADAVRMNLVLFSELGLLERVLQPFAFGDLERAPNALVVGAEAHQAGDDRFVGAVPFPRSGKRTVQLDAGTLRRSADETSGQQPQATCASRVRRRRADHDGTDDVEERDHSSYSSLLNRLSCASSGLQTAVAGSAPYATPPPPRPPRVSPPPRPRRRAFRPPGRDR